MLHGNNGFLNAELPKLGGKKWNAAFKSNACLYPKLAWSKMQTKNN